MTMAIEIEHKYLVKDCSFIELSHHSTNIIQGYISRNKNSTVRVRITYDKAFITLKGKTHQNGRSEFEYQIPIEDAQQIASELCNNIVISKTRYYCTYDGKLWEIDMFHDALDGLIIAEIELTDNNEPYTLPPFIGENVTNIPQYYNSNLITLVEKTQPQKE